MRVTVQLVMAALVAAIHVFRSRSGAKTWIPGSRPGMTMEGGMRSESGG